MSKLAGLKENLSAQCAVHKRLLALEEEKTGILISGDAQALLPMLNEEQALLMQSRELENKRISLYAEPKHKTLRDLIESGEESRVLLAPVFQELTAAVVALKKRSARNKKLLEARLSTIRFLLGNAGQAQGPNTYTKAVHTKG